MHYITTTELRTKSKQLVQLLSSGHSVLLLHRSSVVGAISPETADDPVQQTHDFNSETFAQACKSLKPGEPLSLEERAQRYQSTVQEKHG